MEAHGGTANNKPYIKFEKNYNSWHTVSSEKMDLLMLLVT
jgi:hypothetical protein